MRILITGATGFIGRALVRHALRDPAVREVLAPVRSVSRLLGQLGREGVGADARLRAFEAAAPDWDFRKLGPLDRVVHCAGVLFSRSREEYFRINADGTLRLLETLPGHPRIIILSSQSAGGPTPEGRLCKRITDPDRPVSWYGESKLRMEELVRSSAADRPVLLLRAPMVLGAGDRATLPLFRTVRGRVWPKPGLRTKHFSWLDVEDLADALHAWFTRGPADGVHVAHAVSPGLITDAGLIRTAAAVSGARGFLLPVPQILLRPVALASRFLPAIGENVPSLTPDRAREIWPDRWVIDPEPFASLTGWRGTAALEDTLGSTLRWLQREGLVAGGAGTLGV